MSTTLPPEIEYGFVSGRTIYAVGDTTADDDRYPDAVSATGTVIFTPVNAMRILTQNPAIVVKKPIICTIDPETGELVDEAGHVGSVALVTGEYTVTHSLSFGTIPSFLIKVSPENTVDNPLILAEWVEIRLAPSPGFVFNQNIYNNVLAARDEVVALLEDFSGTDFSVEFRVHSGWLQYRTSDSAPWVDAVDLTVLGFSPIGGSTGQVLAKASDFDLDTEWIDANDHSHPQYLTESDLPEPVDISGKADIGHTHPEYITQADLPDTSNFLTEEDLVDYVTSSDLSTGLADKADADHSHDQYVLGTDERLTDARTPTEHLHAIGEVTGLGMALSGKADASHTHPEYIDTDDPRLSDERTPLPHTHDDRYVQTVNNTEPDENGNVTITVEGGSGPVSWSDIPDKPATFPPTEHEHPEYVNPDLSDYVVSTDPRLSDSRTPSAHQHPTADISGLDEALAGKADSDHAHPEYTNPDLSDYVTTDDERLSDAREPLEHDHDDSYAPIDHSHPEYLTGDDLPDLPDLSGYVRTVNDQEPDVDGNVTIEVEGGSGPVQWDDVLDKPTTYPPNAHAHPEYENPDLSGYVTDDDDRLSDARVPTVHTHSMGDVSDLEDTLANKANTSAVPTEPEHIGAQPAGNYATGAQGARADTAVQPGDLANVATSGAYNDLSGTPTIPTQPGDIGAQPAGDYAPATHTHPEYVETTDSRLTDSRTPTAHEHPEYENPDLSGYATRQELTENYVEDDDPRLSDSRNPTTHSHGWGEITNKPTTFPPSQHDHSVEEVTGLSSTLQSLSDSIPEPLNEGNLGVWGYIPTVIIQNGAELPSPLPAVGVVYELED